MRFQTLRQKKRDGRESPPGVEVSWLRGKDLAPANPALPTAGGLPLGAGPNLRLSEAVEPSRRRDQADATRETAPAPAGANFKSE